ncbi:MAG: N-acetyltransferase [Candidatus Omnitrophica bacterium]|nr:N-acetyltransferase [Candidatus Omnitrophota bacterium]
MQQTDKELNSYFCHETSVVDEGAKIGEGTRIWHFSHILKGTYIGRGCNIGQNVMVGPDVRIGDNVKIQNNVSLYKGITLEDGVFCGPSCVFTNVYNPRSFIRRMDELRPTLVKRGATIGANATVICGKTIGRYALIGAGSVVTHDVPDYALYYGNPGRLKGWVCECGVKLDFEGKNARCGTCGNEYTKTDKGVYNAKEKG